jgi:hypothetical protein
LVAAGDGQEPKDDAAKPQTKPTRFSGNGGRATEKSRLDQCLVLWIIEHGGRSNFQVQLLDEAGIEVNTPIIT